LSGFAGANSVENMPEMFTKRPFFDDYWESKYIHTENINVPMYLLASFSSQLHTRGSFHTFRTAKTSKKWLRVHRYQEWYDLYRPEANADLKRFYDRFLKGIQNGWETDTPPVRLSLLGFEADGSLTKSIEERPEQEWPLARQQLKTLYLDSTLKQLVWEKPAIEGSTTHLAEGLTDSSVSNS
jgi:predicted acyl esterase